MNRIFQLEIDAIVQAFVDRGEIPGAYVSITHHGEVAHTTSIGYADVERRRPIRSDTLYRLYSMTKPITGAAVMRLYEDGLIRVDDPIADYLPEFSEMQVVTERGTEPAAGPIAIRHLMTHTSGIGYPVVPSAVSELYVKHNVSGIANRMEETLASHVNRLARMPLLAHPGKEWNYGESMEVLGRLVEVVSGVPFRTYLKREFFTPLGMRDTDFFVHVGDEDRFAKLYVQDDAGMMIDRSGETAYGGDFCRKPPLEYGGSGLVGTPQDYGRFGSMLLNMGELDGARVLTPDSVRMMTSRQLDEAFVGDRLETVGRSFPSGFGFCGMSGSEVNEDGVEVGTFYGWGGWAGTKFWIDRQNDLQVLLFTQLIPSQVGRTNLEPPIRDVLRKWLIERASNPSRPDLA